MDAHSLILVLSVARYYKSMSFGFIEFDESDIQLLDELLADPIEETARNTEGSRRTYTTLTDLAVKAWISKNPHSHSDALSWNEIIKCDRPGNEEQKAASSNPDAITSLEPLALSRYESNQLLRLDWETLKQKLFHRQKSSSNAVEPPYTDLDCLCQRGGKAANHPGCQSFLKQKEAMQPSYRRASPAEKYQMSKDLVSFVNKRGGRFLKMNSAGTWYELDFESARRKASQALRDRSTNREKAIHRAKNQF